MNAKEFKRDLLIRRTKPVNIILGTDWWTDCDDCVALRLLTRSHKSGLIRLLGVGINGCMEYSAPSVNAFLTYDGLADIPIGIDSAGTDFKGDRHSYQKGLCEYPHAIITNGDCENAVHLYRRLLAQCDTRADILEIGFPQILSGLLQSEPDDVSPLSGKQLVQQKVGRLWMMAGKWNEQPGLEHNFCNNARSAQAGSYVCEKWPGEIVFLGFEVGETVITGKSVKGTNDILALALLLHGSENGRFSWDPMTALLAVTQEIDTAGYAAVRGTASVSAATGENFFAPSITGQHSYVTKSREDSFYTKLIDGIIAFKDE